MTGRARRWAVVPAAGRGERFGGRLPKQYLPLLGRPVLSWTLGALLGGTFDRRRRGGAGRRATAASRGCPRRATRACAPVAAARDASCRWPTRSSRSAGVAARRRTGCWCTTPRGRACARSDLRALFAAVGDDPVGGLLAVPVGDTLKAAGRDGRSERTVSREGLWRALTPQMFRYGVLRRALALSIERERTVTDEASAVEALGLRPRLVRRRGRTTSRSHCRRTAHWPRPSWRRWGDASGENRLRVRRPRASSPATT